MQLNDYANKLLNVISVNPYIESQNLSFEERPPNAAYISGTINFVDGSKLYFKEYVVFKPEDTIYWKFGYSYLDRGSALIFRYDNALDPKAKGLPTYPEHKHIANILTPAKRPLFKDLLMEISEEIRDKKHEQAESEL